MSNRRKLPRPQPSRDPSEQLAALDGTRVPGGCDHCNAYQEVQAHAFGHQRIHMINVFHDSWCPELARQRGRNR